MKTSTRTNAMRQVLKVFAEAKRRLRAAAPSAPPVGEAGVDGWMLPANGHDASDHEKCEPDGCDFKALVNAVFPPTPDALIKHMVDRFLNWRLPPDFSPDAGISWNGRHDPVGTNLFTATQAEAMVRHMLSDVSIQPPAVRAAIMASSPYAPKPFHGCFCTYCQKCEEAEDRLARLRVTCALCGGSGIEGPDDLRCHGCDGTGASSAGAPSP